MVAKSNCQSDGDFNSRGLGRLLTHVGDSGATPVAVLNEADLASDIRMFTDILRLLQRQVLLHRCPIAKRPSAKSTHTSAAIRLLAPSVHPKLAIDFN